MSNPLFPTGCLIYTDGQAGNFGPKAGYGVAKNIKGCEHIKIATSREGKSLGDEMTYNNWINRCFTLIADIKP